VVKFENFEANAIQVDVAASVHFVILPISDDILF
jgi:hypothetical protein